MGALGPQLLAAHPIIDAIIAPNDEVAYGLIDSLHTTTGRMDKMIISGYDAGPDALLSISNGELTASVQQPLTQLGIAAHTASQVIVDITGVPLVDTMVANSLIRAAQTGIRPEVAQTLVSLGSDLSSLATQGSLQSAIRQAFQRT